MIPTKDFSAPIPGQSLTGEMGQYPWERPPKHVDPHEAADMIWQEITFPDTIAQILWLLEEGVSITEMAKLVLTKAFHEGLITYDLCVMLAHPVCAMLEAMAKRAKIKYDLTPPKGNPITKLVLDKLLAEPVPEEEQAKGEQVSEKLPENASGFFKRGE